MTREGRRTPRAWRKYETAASIYEELFAALFQTSVTIKGVKEMTEEDGGQPVEIGYILSTIYNSGAIAFHKPTKLWLPFWGTGKIDEYGNYEELRLYAKNGRLSRTVKAKDCYIFNSSQNNLCIGALLRQKCTLLANLDLSINQNLNAVKTANLIKYSDPELKQKLIEAETKRQAGESLIPLQEDAARLGKLELLRTEAPYLVDKLQAAKRAEFEDCLHLVGIKTPNEKAERLINSEVQTQGAEASAYLGIIIKTFNEDAKRQGAPVEMIYDPIEIDPDDLLNQTGENDNNV